MIQVRTMLHNKKTISLFRQAINRCKRVLEAAKIAYINKAKDSITFQELSSRNIWQIADSVLNKGKSDITPLFNKPELLSSASNKAKLLAENFSENFSGISLPVCTSITNLKLHNISINSNMIKRVTRNLNCLKCLVLIVFH